MKKNISYVLILLLLFSQIVFAENLVNTNEIIQNNINSKQELKINSIDLNNEILKEYQKNHIKYLKKIVRENSIFRPSEKFDTFEKYQSITNGEFVKINLLDNDFAVYSAINNNDSIEKIVMEYHANGELMGEIIVIPLKISKNENILMFSEYRETDTSKYYFSLKHILILDIRKTKNDVTIAQFLYENENFDRNKACNFILKNYSINDEIYINKDEKNLIPKINQNGLSVISIKQSDILKSRYKLFKQEIYFNAKMLYYVCSLSIFAAITLPVIIPASIIEGTIQEFKSK